MKELPKNVRIDSERIKEFQDLEQRADALREESKNLYSKAQMIKRELLHLDFEGKYIKYIDTFDSTPIYMKVDWITISNNYDRFDFAYLFRGFGFWGEFSGYLDATSFNWDYSFEFTIYGDEKEFLNKVNKIEVIDKCEFDEAFEEMITSIKEYHYKIK